MNFSISLRRLSPIDSSPDWYNESNLWQKLNNDVGGDPSLPALTVKAIYLTGTIFNICESVSFLLKHEDFARQVSYIPGYGVYASAIELLGRAVCGSANPRKSCLKTGFQWLHQPSFTSYVNFGGETSIIRTDQGQYSINELASLRNYAAHGQAVSDCYNVDYEIIIKLHRLLKLSISSYWTELQSSEHLCNNLATANIVPIRGLSILKFTSLMNQTQSSQTSIGEIFAKFDSLFSLQ